MECNPATIAKDGAIENFLGHIFTAAKNSNGFVLELGTALGTGSTYSIHSALQRRPDVLHISVDWQDRMIWKPECDWWHYVIGDDRSAETYGRVRFICGDRKPGLIFIDTDHTYEQMKKELEIWSPLADENTVWLFHDTYMLGKYNHMADAIKEFAASTYGEWIYEDVSTEAHGLGRMRHVNNIPINFDPPALGDKLNCGSGQRPFDHSLGWVNIDINPRWNPDLLANWNDLSAFDDWTIEYVVSHHSLEHVRFGEGDKFIEEAYRVLRPGGSLIVTVPDMRALAKRWLVNQMDTDLYMTNVYGAWMGHEADSHKSGYDADSLIKYLSRFPFSEVKRFNYRQIPGADIAKDFWILGVEAVK